MSRLIFLLIPVIRLWSLETQRSTRYLTLQMQNFCLLSTVPNGWTIRC